MQLIGCMFYCFIIYFYIILYYIIFYLKIGNKCQAMYHISLMTNLCFLFVIVIYYSWIEADIVLVM